MEFEQETTGGTKYLPNYIYDHWQEVRERAAIAAMQGVMISFGPKYTTKETFAKLAVEQADALVEQLKKKKQ